MATTRTRFYQDASVASKRRGYGVLLDGKPIHTPAGAELVLPTRPLAEVIAEEWRSQGEKVRPDTMLLTKLANTAIDRVAVHRLTAISQILGFARSDLLCYRAEAPEALVELQHRVWDPILDWARERYGATLACGTGIGFIEQAPASLVGLERALDDYDSFGLSGLQAAGTLLGSALIALALAERRLTPEEAFEAAQLDETYQAEKWGRDFEADQVRSRKLIELLEIALFLRALEDGGRIDSTPSAP
jgi:chaperone required for assembly of F1-ATPase